jgi:L-alanine-DL-glutamate epimerase-like enolase superfamily enzyme
VSRRGAVVRVSWTVAATGAAGRGRWPTRRAAVIGVPGARGWRWGEAAPLPGFGDDDLDRATAELAAWLDEPRAPLTSPSARYAVEQLARPPGPAPALTAAVVVDDPAAAAAAVAAGAPALKLKLDGHDDRARVAAIRAAAPRAALHADANQIWPLAEVGDRLADLADLGLAYVEEPAAGLAARLRGPLAVPVALDESLADPERERWLPAALASGALAALVCKPTVLGGRAGLAPLWAAAQAAGVAVSVSHALEGPLALASHRALAAALAPTALHGLGPHPALAAWAPLTVDGAAVGDDDAVAAALATLGDR